MKKRIGIFLILLVGCSTHWVSSPAPTEPISTRTAVRASGVLQPQDFYFTLISQYHAGQARVIVFTEPALKLADLTVSKKQVQLHYQAPKIPSKLIEAWVQLVREHFLVSCPARDIRYKTTTLKGQFELEVTGGICL